MEENMQRLQNLEQNLQTYGLQIQTTQGQLMEVESALKEVSDEAYRILGNIMVKVDAKKLAEELSEKKGVLASRLSTVKKQEERVRKEAEELQKEIMSSMEGK